MLDIETDFHGWLLDQAAALRGLEIMKRSIVTTWQRNWKLWLRVSGAK